MDMTVPTSLGDQVALLIAQGILEQKSTEVGDRSTLFL
jgi:hypothetical protein